MITLNLIYTILMFVFYGILNIAVPAIALYPLIRERELGYRILFYQISNLTYVSMTSFALAYLGLYSFVASWIVFFFIPIGFRAFLSRHQLREAYTQWFSRRTVGLVLHEGSRLKFRRTCTALKNRVRAILKTTIGPSALSILAFLLIVFLVAKDLGYFHLHSYTYACSDEPTHIYWVSSLIHGDPFPAGLYPHGMHFLVAQVCSMFGLNIARAWLSFGIVSVTVILFSAFLCAGRIFSNRVTGILGVALFLGAGIFPTTVWYERLQMVMPMEFAMYAFFVTIYGLVTWISDRKNGSLLMVGMGILGTTLIHFFVTIFTFFMVVAFIIVFHGEMARSKSLHKLFLCGILSVIVAVLPYIAGFAFGYHLEQSFKWGMDNVSVGSSTSTGGSQAVYTPSVGESRIEEPVSYTVKDMYKEAESVGDYMEIFGVIVTKYLTNTPLDGLILLGFCASLFLYGVISFFLRKKEEKKTEALVFVFISVTWLMEFVVLYVGYVLKLFSLMIPTRSTEFIAMLSILIIGVPIRILLDLCRVLKLNVSNADGILTGVSLAAVAIMSVRGFGVGHEILQYGFTMENVDIQAEEILVNEGQNETWTYIGTTNARMAALYYGFHYEITDLLIVSRDKKELYIPTKDIYISVEKNVPTMGNKKVDGSNYNENTVPVSAYYANVLLSDVLQYSNGSINSEVYLNNYSRMVIMSHLYYWMEKLKTVYPNEVSVFLEDENCTIYHIRQDEYFLLNLVMKYSDLVERDLMME